MQFVIQKRVPTRLRDHAIARPGRTEVAIADASPCPNVACRAPGWLLAGKPRNWPWADHCWNCGAELR
jgi:hypothetical protein